MSSAIKNSLGLLQEIKSQLNNSRLATPSPHNPSDNLFSNQLPSNPTKFLPSNPIQPPPMDSLIQKNISDLENDCDAFVDKINILMNHLTNDLDSLKEKESHSKGLANSFRQLSDKFERMVEDIENS